MYYTVDTGYLKHPWDLTKMLRYPNVDSGMLTNSVLCLTLYKFAHLTYKSMESLQEW